MMNNNFGSSKSNTRQNWLRLLALIILLVTLLLLGIFFLKKGSAEAKEAPEAGLVLNTQAGLPFQVLIPAYLPPIFLRERMEIKAGLTGPEGQPMIQLVYPTRKGNSLVLSEWISAEAESDEEAKRSPRCRCTCRLPDECEMLALEVTVGKLQVLLEFSVANLLTYEQLQFVIDTLGPAANQQVYSSVEEVPLTYSFPPAVEVPVNEEGVQELTLVVTPDGYSPVHFAVKKDIPVRVIFKQLGQVGCGNELYLDWGEGESAYLYLASPSDKQVVEFTPSQPGEYIFHCPHYIYRGAMTIE
ncbi:MAG: hypothetical protein EHM70_13275 [Chloroflexota bacterium]|nr:MAG: hypothetical protein EHM70_13275 [Chloroflexota bacterium]